MSGFVRNGGRLAIPFAVLAVIGLALWFYGANLPDEAMSAAEVEEHANSVGLALAGATVIIVSMLFLFAYAVWLRLRYPRNVTVGAGALILALGGLSHLVENVLVLVLFSSDMSNGDALWRTISTLSFLGFGLIGVGTLVVSVGLPGPRWLRIWGGVSGVLGVVAALGAFVPVLAVAAGPFNLSVLAWMITLGLLPVASRERETAVA
jgi:hypothetical protein